MYFGSLSVCLPKDVEPRKKLIRKKESKESRKMQKKKLREREKEKEGRQTCNMLRAVSIYV